MQHRDHRGLSLTARDPQSVDRYEAALTLLHGYYGDPLSAIEPALQEDPEFVMGHAFKAGLLVMGLEQRALPELSRSVAAAEAIFEGGRGTERERAHIAAARAWLHGDFLRATDVYNRIALEYPRDAFAVQVAHVCNFGFGRATWLRDHVAHALPHYGASEPTYSYLLGMLAFGLEECNEFERAEEAGRQALALHRRDPWAVHAVAHCYEMQGRVSEGIEWLEAREPDFAPNSFMAVHNFWHLALFYLDLGARERVLELYDRRVRGAPSEVLLDVVDASSLLWRLQLRAYDVGDRFRELARTWRRIEEERFYAFSDVHALMAYAGAGLTEDVQRVLSGLEERSAGTGTNAALSRDIGLPVCRAFAAFASGDARAAVEDLLAVRPLASAFGGSNAQRDVLDLTLIEAALRGKEFALARGLVESRSARKPSNPEAHLSRARIFQAMACPELAAMARSDAARAQSAQQTALQPRAAE